MALVLATLPPSIADGQTTATDFPFGRSDSSLNLENWNAISDHLGRGKEERTPRTKVECSVDRGRRCRCRSRTFVRERKEERRTLRPRPSVRPSVRPRYCQPTIDETARLAELRAGGGGARLDSTGGLPSAQLIAVRGCVTRCFFNKASLTNVGSGLPIRPPTLSLHVYHAARSSLCQFSSSSSS